MKPARDEISFSVELWDWEGPGPYGWIAVSSHATAEEALEKAAHKLNTKGGKWRVVRVRKTLLREL